MYRPLIVPLSLLALTGLVRPAAAETVVVPEADFDRWMYPFNGSPGTRNLAPTFSAVGSAGFDNRDGQFLVGFNTSAAGIPTGLAPSQYQILSVKVTATHSTGSFEYDPTYDSYQTYLDSGDPNFVADADAGRPIELHGIGLRNGYASLGFGATVPGPTVFEQSDVFSLGPPTVAGTRNAFPLAFGVPDVEGDVSNNVIHTSLSSGFESNPWAIGQSTSGLLPGDLVPQGVAGVSAGETFEFDLDLTSSITNYLQNGLSNGGLFFAITSLHGADEMSGGQNPNFYTRDNFDPAAIAPTLTVEYAVVPEPATWGLAATGMACVAAFGWRRRRRSIRVASDMA